MIPNCLVSVIYGEAVCSSNICPVADSHNRQKVGKRLRFYI